MVDEGIIKIKQDIWVPWVGISENDAWYPYASGVSAVLQRVALLAIVVITTSR